MRRIIIIIASVIFLLAIGFGVYFFSAHRARVVVAPTRGTAFPTGTKKAAGGTHGGVGAQSSTTTPIVVNPVSNTFATSNASTTRPRLIKITNGPVVPGIVVFDTATSTKTMSSVVSYIDRKSGNGYRYTVASGVLSRLSNKTIPGIESAAWLSNGSLAYLRYRSTTHSTETYALPANGIGGFFLAQGISSIAVNESNAILTLVSDTNGSIITRARTNSSKPFTAFQTPLSSIIVSFAGPNNYLVYTKPSAAIAGYAFLVNKKTDAWERVAGPLDGLVALSSPNGNTLLISYVDSNEHMQTALVTVSTLKIVPLPVVTIANKCVWATDSSAVYCGIPNNPPTATYPDNWYQGAVSFSDRIWKINVKSRYAQLVLDFSKETGKNLDATTLAVDPNMETLSFINKNNGSLWEYSL